MFTDELKKTIKERYRLHEETQDEAYWLLDECLTNMMNILSSDLSQTVEFIKKCSDYDFIGICETFRDITEKTKNREFLKCIEERNNLLRDDEFRECINKDIERIKNTFKI